MKYAHKTKNGHYDEWGTPRNLRRIDNNASVLMTDSIDDATLAECGWFPLTETPQPASTIFVTYDLTVKDVRGEPTEVWVERMVLVDVPRPADTPTTTYDRSTVNGTVVWTERPKMQAELTADVHGANRGLIDAAITSALSELRAIINAPAIPTVPDGTLTTAQLSNAMRSMRAVVQENRAATQRIAQTLKQTIRLLRGDFDGTD